IATAEAEGKRELEAFKGFLALREALVEQAVASQTMLEKDALDQKLNLLSEEKDATRNFFDARVADLEHAEKPEIISIINMKTARESALDTLRVKEENLRSARIKDDQIDLAFEINRIKQETEMKFKAGEDAQKIALDVSKQISELSGTELSTVQRDAMME